MGYGAIMTMEAVPVVRSRRAPRAGFVEGRRVLRRLPDGVSAQPYQRFELTPLGPLIGAEIRGVDLSLPVPAEVRREIHRALLEWKVVFFRDQSITSAQQRAFAAHWGELETNPLLASGDSDQVVRFDKTTGSPTYENVWHVDVTFRERPAMGAVLQLREVPPVGGETMWSDMAAAYDNLPAELAARLDGLTAVHDFVPGFERFTDPAKLAAFADRFPPVEHPVVRVHPETGRRTLFVNTSFTTHIVGMDPDESDRLLQLLYQQAHVPEYQVRFHWGAGDVAFWDNRATQHYAVNDYYPHRRVAERVAIAGDRPFGVTR